MNEFKLTDTDKNSGLWVRLNEMLAARLVSLRIQNDRDMSEIETAKFRGRIEEVKRMLDFGKEDREFK